VVIHAKPNHVNVQLVTDMTKPKWTVSQACAIPADMHNQAYLDSGTLLMTTPTWTTAAYGDV